MAKLLQGLVELPGNDVGFFFFKAFLFYARGLELRRIFQHLFGDGFFSEEIHSVAEGIEEAET